MIKNAHWLKKRIRGKNFKVLDATWYLPNLKKYGYEDFKRAHIPGAIFFDIDKISDHKSSYPHMLPKKKDFERMVSGFGICNTDTIVIYCKTGILSSPRVWWTFRYFGHKNVYILNGGLKAWKLANGSLETKEKNHTKTYFKCRKIKDKLLTSYKDLKNYHISNNLSHLIIDCRPKNRFKALEDEPRANIGRGHIPNSLNYPFNIFDHNGYLRSKTQLKVLLKNVLLKKKEIICSCGSGISACNLALSLSHIGYKNWSVYDGSWTEWFIKNS